MWRTWLIILLTVLAPVRGWAWSAMSVESASHALHQAVQAPAHASCHEAPEASGQASADTDHGAPCQHCDVCHAVMAPPAWSEGLRMQPPAVGWLPAYGQAAWPDHTSRLFRPPRS